MRVFVSHASKDKPAVIPLAEALRAHGIDPWLDAWEIGAADNFVAKINQGLRDSDAAIIVFSAHAAGSPWVSAEVDYLIWAWVKHGMTVIPVVLVDDTDIPPLLRPLMRRHISETDAIVEALHNRRRSPATPLGVRAGHTIAVRITLRRQADAAIAVTVDIDGARHGETTVPGLPPALVEAQNRFLQGRRQGIHRDASGPDPAGAAAELAALGQALGALCFPGPSARALAALVDCPAGTLIETTFAADDPLLLGLAFEAARLPDGRVLALQAPVVTMRTPLGGLPQPHAALAGPLKILLAVAAPDVGGSSLLDYERETQNILNAVEPASRLENCQVRILEIGHPDPIAAAFAADAYHVLHLSCHGGPGVLELEDEDGNPCPTRAVSPPGAVQPGVKPPPTLLDPIRRTGRPLPLVLLNACHGGVSLGQTASFAEDLLRGGVPAVLAMQAPVSDRYAIQIADAFYRALIAPDAPRPSLALAQARKAIEQQRLEAVRRGAPAVETQPEYATVALFVAGADRPLLDAGAPKQPLRVAPVHVLGGVVPQLPQGELIGRRRELREILKTLRDPARSCSGVVLTGIGGVGKSALAGRVMARQSEAGWLMAAVQGPFSLTGIALAVGLALLTAGRAPEVAKLLVQPELDDRLRGPLLGRALAENPVLLVLDDFEQNLTTGGDAFLNPDVADQLRDLAKQARTGRLLITCRYPLPGFGPLLHSLAVPPLSPAETRKKLLRLPALGPHAATALRAIGGHPRMLEFLDALLSEDPSKSRSVGERLVRLAAAHGVDISRAAPDLDAAKQAALTLGARDIVLEALLAIVRQEGHDTALFQTAVSNLPVPASGLARMLAADDGPGDAAAAEASLSRLAALSLLHLGPDGALVHRWTAEALAALDGEPAHQARCVRAAGYRLWRTNHESHDVNDAVEALRNLLTGEAFDAAAALALELLGMLSQARQSVAVAGLAAEVLESLPETHAGFAPIADAEAQAHLALGATDRALRRYNSLLIRHEQKSKAAPDRADYQRDLSVFYERMGDLYRALGQGEAARDAFAKSLAIAEKLARDEPDRADYQRDLSVSYNKMGDLYTALGQGEAARDAFAKSLAIAEKLARDEPDRADYQRDLSVSYNKMGDLYTALGQGEAARDAFAKSLAIAEKLARDESDRADYQRDLSVSYGNMGDLYTALGQGEAARDAFAKSLAIREKLARDEPDRADYQRDLSVSYGNMGDLYTALGQGEAARDAFAKSLAIFEKLARDEPDRADYQRDLVVSLVRQAELAAGDERRTHLQRALGIVKALHASGRLRPIDAWMLDDLPQRIAASAGGGRDQPPNPGA
jgi:tetratricopeptide (TPR) repeat protein